MYCPGNVVIVGGRWCVETMCFAHLRDDYIKQGLSTEYAAVQKFFKENIRFLQRGLNLLAGSVYIRIK